MPKILDFENKRAYFKLRQDNRRSYGRTHLTIRRSNIFADSYHAIMSRSPEELKVYILDYLIFLEKAPDRVQGRGRHGRRRCVKRVVQPAFEGDLRPRLRIIHPLSERWNILAKSAQLHQPRSYSLL